MMKYLVQLYRTFLNDKLDSLLLNEKFSELLVDLFESVSLQPLVSPFLIVFQFTERSETQALFESMQDVAKYIFVVFSIAVMMLTPLMFCYFLIEKYFNFKLYCDKLRKKLKYLEDKPNHAVPNWLLNKYRNSFADYIGNGVGLGGWVLLSILYMIVGFDNFRSGIQAYFNFPFDVIQAIGEDNWNFIGSDLYRTWTFMLIIVAVSMLLWVIGRGIGEYYAKRRIESLTKSPQAQLA